MDHSVLKGDQMDHGGPAFPKSILDGPDPLVVVIALKIKCSITVCQEAS